MEPCSYVKGSGDGLHLRELARLFGAHNIGAVEKVQGATLRADT